MEVYRETTGSTTPEEVREALLGSEQHRYDPRFVRAFGPAAGVFASQLLYLEGKRRWDDEGYIYKSARELEAETGLSRRQQEKARKVLGSKGVLYEKDAKGPDGRQRKFYKLDLLALLETVAPAGAEEEAGDESRCTKYSNTMPGISEQGHCTVVPDSDRAHYSGRSKQESTQESVSDGYAEERNPSSSPANTDPLQQQDSSKGLVGEVVRRSRRAGYELEPRQIRALGRDLKALLAEEPEESHTADVLSAIEAEARRGHGCSVKKAREIVAGKADGYTPHRSNRGPETTTPEAGIQALRDYEHPNYGHNDLKDFIPVAQAWDFTQDEPPPPHIVRRLSRDEIEAHQYVDRLRSVTRRAVRRASESAPSEPEETKPQPEDVGEIAKREYPEVA